MRHANRRDEEHVQLRLLSPVKVTKAVQDDLRVHTCVVLCSATSGLPASRSARILFPSRNYSISPATSSPLDNGEAVIDEIRCKLLPLICAWAAASSIADRWHSVVAAMSCNHGVILSGTQRHRLPAVLETFLSEKMSHAAEQNSSMLMMALTKPVLMHTSAGLSDRSLHARRCASPAGSENGL